MPVPECERPFCLNEYADRPLPIKSGGPVMAADYGHLSALTFDPPPL